MDGFLVIDQTPLDGGQDEELRALMARFGGWTHPDGIRVLLPVPHPTDLRDKLMSNGWPAGSIVIPK